VFYRVQAVSVLLLLVGLCVLQAAGGICTIIGGAVCSTGCRRYLYYCYWWGCVFYRVQAVSVLLLLVALCVLQGAGGICTIVIGGAVCSAGCRRYLYYYWWGCVFYRVQAVSVLLLVGLCVLQGAGGICVITCQAAICYVIVIFVVTSTTWLYSDADAPLEGPVSPSVLTPSS
jgi:hypothetical protein